MGWLLNSGWLGDTGWMSENWLLLIALTGCLGMAGLVGSCKFCHNAHHFTYKGHNWIHVGSVLWLASWNIWLG